MTTAFDNPLLNETPDALLIMTPGNEAVDWNNRVETDLTYRSAKAVRRLLNEIMAPPDRVEEDGGMLRRQRR